MIPEDVIVKACDEATGYADGIQRAAKVLADYVEPGDVEDFLLDQGIEKCPECEWFAECGEMIPDGADDPDGHCSNCRPSSRDE